MGGLRREGRGEDSYSLAVFALAVDNPAKAHAPFPEVGRGYSTCPAYHTYCFLQSHKIKNCIRPLAFWKICGSRIIHASPAQ